MAKKAVGSTVIPLILLLAILQVSEVVEANPFLYPASPSPEKPILTVKNPQNYSTYGVDGVPVDFSVVQPDSWGVPFDFFFYLGYVTNVEVSVDGNASSYPYNTNYSLMLNHLPLGTHQVNITVNSYSIYTKPVSGSQNIPINVGGEGLYKYPIVVSDTFYVTVTPPKVLILSPQTTATYNDSSVSLVYSVNEATSRLSFSLDGQTNRTAPSNATLNYLSDEGYNASLYTSVLTDLSYGRHSVTVYAADVLGNIGSQTVNFTVEKPQMFGSALTVAVVAVPVAIVVLIAGLILYRRQKMTKNT